VGITFWPVPGTVLMCDFTSNKEPEMVKVRRVVVVSSGEARQIMLVVPLSTTPPSRPRPVHVRLGGHYAFLAAGVWAKCDLVTHVAPYRLDRIRVGNRYLNGWESQVTNRDLMAVRYGVVHALDLGPLIRSARY
jgi:uncharacterized protein YifN (PemK superfamily)